MVVNFNSIINSNNKFNKELYKSIIFHNYEFEGGFQQYISHEIICLSYFCDLLKQNGYMIEMLANSFICYCEKVEKYCFLCHNHYDFLDMVRAEVVFYINSYDMIMHVKRMNAPTHTWISYDQIIKFGEIITKYLIRVLGIDIVGVQNEKIVLTSNTNLGDDIKKILDDKYKIFKMQKAIYNYDEYDLFGEYEFVKSLPNVPDYCECFLETELDHFEKVLRKR